MSTEQTYYSLFDTHIAGGFSEVEIPSPIPNLEVKHFCADNTAGPPCGNVGRRQLFESFFIPLSYAFFTLLFYFNIFTLSS